MSISSIRDDAKRVSGIAIENRAFAAASVGEALERELGDPATLVMIGEQVVHCAQDRGYKALAGASVVGERLAAAAIAISNNGLHLRQLHNGEPVLIVDGILVTGAQISEAARRLRADGVSKAAAAVVLATGRIHLSPLVDELVVLDG